LATKWIALLCLVAVVVGLVLGHFAWTHHAPVEKETLTIYHAGSLGVPFQQMADEFESTHPDVDVLLESSGSVDAVRKITELGKEADILASADYSLIPTMMYPDYADWYIAFGGNEVVLCYSDDISHNHADQIIQNGGQRTWYDVLRNDDVSYGHSDPDADPCGYRTLMVIQLAEKYYYDNATDFSLTPDPTANGLYDALINGEGMDQGRYSIDRELVRPKSVQLVALLQTGDLDYAFEYLSVAQQNDLNYIVLPEEINLASVAYQDFYSEVSVEIQTTPTETQIYNGTPIVYGVTIPENAPNPERAAEFIDLLLSETGRGIMTENFQPPIYPAQCDAPDNLPEGVFTDISVIPM
jgi:molybdate/tungstate transport system substrate-binding protein